MDIASEISIICVLEVKLQYYVRFSCRYLVCRIVSLYKSSFIVILRDWNELDDVEICFSLTGSGYFLFQQQM